MTNTPLQTQRAGQKRPLRLLLIDTAAPDVPGSMHRYADLVEQAFANAALAGAGSPAIQIHRLSIPVQWPKRAVAALRPWIRHAECSWVLRREFSDSRSAVGRFAPDMVHLVDGSYGYLMKWLPASVARLVTIHDLIPFLELAGELSSAPSRLSELLLNQSRKGWAAADVVASVSAHTQQDLQRFTNLEPERCRVIHNPIDPFWISDAPQPLAARQPLVLHIGSNQRYKNRADVLRIFAAAAVDGARLLMAGAAATQELIGLAAHLGISDAIEWHVQLSDQELRVLYGRARVLLFPSKYEGFGWPLLEAMGAGCAVVCSDKASLPEVLGGAGQSYSLDDIPSFAAGLAKLLMNGEALAAAQVNADQGYQRAKEFSLERFARQLQSGYEAALEQRKQTIC